MSNFHLCKAITNPMDSSWSIRHPFDVDIPRGKFVKMTKILKGESTTSIMKLLHPLGNYDIDSTWIRLSKLTKYR